MNLVPGSEEEPDKSPGGGGAKVRNPAQGVRIGETVPQRSRRPQASPARHGEPLMRSMIAVGAGQSPGRAGQSAQPPKQQTKSQVRDMKPRPREQHHTRDQDDSPGNRRPAYGTINEVRTSRDKEARPHGRQGTTQPQQPCKETRTMPIRDRPGRGKGKTQAVQGRGTKRPNQKGDMYCRCCIKDQ